MRMTSTGALPRALAAARPPKPPPTITTRGVFDGCSSAPLIELRLASFIHPFLKLLSPEISENLGFSRWTSAKADQLDERTAALVNRARSGSAEPGQAWSPRATGSVPPRSSFCGRPEYHYRRSGRGQRIGDGCERYKRRIANR